jgi:hypothetical protein
LEASSTPQTHNKNADAPIKQAREALLAARPHHPRGAQGLALSPITGGTHLRLGQAAHGGVRLAAAC